MSLSERWEFVELGKLATVQSGGTPSRNKPSYWGGKIPWIKISDIKNLYVDEATEFITAEGLKNSSARIFPKGTILLTIFATIGRVGILNIDAATNQAIAGITPNKDIESKFLVYALVKLSQSFLEKGKGVAQKNINQSILKESIIPLPPLAEQKRIVAKLDETFEHIKVLKSKLDQIPVLLKQFKQTVLTHAVTGKLTEEWRKGKGLEEWKLERVENLCLSISDGDHQAPPQVSIGIPFLVISNVSKGYFDFDTVSRFVPEYYFDSIKETRVPRKGDVLYTVTGSYGIPLLVDFDKKFCFQRHIAILKPNKTRISSEYLAHLLKSELIIRQADNVATGTAQVTVSLRGIKSFEAEIPSILEQAEITKKVDSLFLLAGKIERQFQGLKEKTDKLPQALLSKAFKGELVTQDENDEQAKKISGRLGKINKILK